MKRPYEKTNVNFMFSHLDRLPGLDFPNHQKSWYGRCKHFLPPQQTRFLGKFIKNISSLLAPPHPPPKKKSAEISFNPTNQRALQHVEWPWALGAGPNGFFLEILRKNQSLHLAALVQVIAVQGFWGPGGAT